MNEKLLELAKAAGLEEHAIHGGLIARLSNGYWVDIKSKLNKFTELVQANAAADAEAKLVTAIQLLQQLDDEWSRSGFGYNPNVRRRIQEFLQAVTKPSIVVDVVTDAEAKLKIAIEALKAIIDGTYHRDRDIKCADGKFSWEDCEQCIERHVMQALEKIGEQKL